MYVGLGAGLNTRIECWCKTCQGYVTVEEVRVNHHAGHDFSPEDLAALQAVRQYLERQEKQRAADASDRTA